MTEIIVLYIINDVYEVIDIMFLRIKPFLLSKRLT